MLRRTKLYHHFAHLLDKNLRLHPKSHTHQAHHKVGNRQCSNLFKYQSKLYKESFTFYIIYIDFHIFIIYVVCFLTEYFFDELLQDTNTFYSGGDTFLNFHSLLLIIFFIFSIRRIILWVFSGRCGDDGNWTLSDAVLEAITYLKQIQLRPACFLWYLFQFGKVWLEVVMWAGIGQFHRDWSVPWPGFCIRKQLGRDTFCVFEVTDKVNWLDSSCSADIRTWHWAGYRTGFPAVQTISKSESRLLGSKLVSMKPKLVCNCLYLSESDFKKLDSLPERPRNSGPHQLASYWYRY